MLEHKLMEREKNGEKKITENFIAPLTRLGKSQVLLVDDVKVNFA